MITHHPNLFYALWPDEASRAELTKLQARTHGRLTRPQNFHLTLAFLGPLPDALLPVLRSTLKRIDFAPIDLTIDRLGYFQHNAIAWAGMHTPPPALLHLQKMLAQELVHKGIAYDAGRSFNPHITLARKAAAPCDLPFTPFHWHTEQMVLAQSPQADEEPFYRVLASHPCKQHVD